jgi:hypothetical protein
MPYRHTITTDRDLVAYLDTVMGYSQAEAEARELPLRRAGYAAGLAMGDDWGLWLEDWDCERVDGLLEDAADDGDRPELEPRR